MKIGLAGTGLMGSTHADAWLQAGATGTAKADAYKAGVQSLGAQGYTALQLMQIVGDQKVRVVPDVAVSGNGGAMGLTEGLLGMLLHKQATGGEEK